MQRRQTPSPLSDALPAGEEAPQHVRLGTNRRHRHALLLRLPVVPLLLDPNGSRPDPGAHRSPRRDAPPHPRAVRRGAWGAVERDLFPVRRWVHLPPGKLLVRDEERGRGAGQGDRQQFDIEGREEAVEDQAERVVFEQAEAGRLGDVQGYRG